MGIHASDSRNRRLFAAVLIAVLTLSGLSAVAAQNEGGIGGDGSANATAGVFSPGGVSGGPAPAGASTTTPWPYLCDFGDYAGNIYQNFSPPVPRLEEGHFYHVDCDATDPAFNDYVVQFWQYIPGVPHGTAGVVTTYEVLEVATDSVLPPPLPVGIAPELRQVTGLETWLWPDGDVTTPVTAQAHAGTPGSTYIEVTAEATWQGTRFDMGDGNVVECTTQDIWVSGAGESGCVHTYLEEGTYTITAVSTWEYVWWDSTVRAPNPPDGRPIGTFPFTETLTVDVIDIEALISR